MRGTELLLYTTATLQYYAEDYSLFTFFLGLYIGTLSTKS